MLKIRSAVLSMLLCGLAASAMAQTPAPAAVAHNKVQAPAMMKKATPAHRKVVARKPARKKPHKAKTATTRKKHAAKPHTA